MISNNVYVSSTLTLKPSAIYYDRDPLRGGASSPAIYGGLFSLTFHFTHSIKGVFDALPCHKGPSLGTNFTPASPYTILAHFTELKWAAEFGVGMEGTDALLRSFEVALAAAEAVTASSSQKKL